MFAFVECCPRRHIASENSALCHIRARRGDGRFELHAVKRRILHGADAERERRRRSIVSPSSLVVNSKDEEDQGERVPTRSRRPPRRRRGYVVVEIERRRGLRTLVAGFIVVVFIAARRLRSFLRFVPGRRRRQWEWHQLSGRRAQDGEAPSGMHRIRTRTGGAAT